LTTDHRALHALAVGALSAAVLAIAALGIAGCASSSTSSGNATVAPGSAISKSEFVSKANAICVKGNAATKAAGAKLGAAPSEKAVVDYVRRVEVPAVQAQIDAIRALGAPAGDQATINKMLDLAQTAVDRVKAVPAILTTGQDVFARFAKVAHPYGLTSCAPSS
jgi:hypothetical protein